MYDNDGYTPSEDGPEAELYRRDADRQAQWERFCANRAEILLSTISPFDSTRSLFSYAEIRRWRIRRK